MGYWRAQQLTYDRIEENETRVQQPPIAIEDDFQKFYHGCKFYDIKFLRNLLGNSRSVHGKKIKMTEKKLEDIVDDERMKNLENMLEL